MHTRAYLLAAQQRISAMTVLEVVSVRAFVLQQLKQRKSVAELQKKGMANCMCILTLGHFHSGCAVRKAEYVRSIGNFSVRAGSVHVPSSCLLSCMQSSRE